ncbi:histidine kinase [Leifsonia shinshuensis]|uniref:sensor histidine kinase n=1 Tax=Leifsonia shinshuensis TaxID=150026 RepID=UPI00285F62C7|nr:histidine kinase [Leifsonia shinshuensis]MDR6971401.1 signal transduction histidine kinase [Leifsonia shinshuensis]
MVAAREDLGAVETLRPGSARPHALRLALRALAVTVAVASNVLAQVVSAMTNDYGPRPSGAGWAIVFVTVALDYVVCAVVAWRLVRSWVPGWLMVLAAVFWSAGAWYPLVRQWGWVWPWVAGVTDLWAVLVGILVLCYPTGRLRARFDRVVVLVVTIAFAIRLGGILLFSSPEPSECGCAPNAYAVLPSDAADYWLGLGWRFVGLALMLTVAARLIARWFTSSLPARRVAFVMPLAILLWCYGTVQDSLSFALGWNGGWLQFIPPVAIALIPPAFVGGVLYARGLRSRVADLVIVARDKVDRALWESSLARTLHDSSLRVFWWDEPLQRYQTSDGRPTPEAGPAARPGRSTLAIDSDQGPIALIEHDVALTQDDRLLDAVSSALLLSVDNDRLRARLERTIQELRESRLRIVEEGYLARRQLERDLHDGSQQQLVSLAISLRIATSKAEAHGDEELAGDLQRSSEQLADALRELRELARGIHPTVLSDGDLRSALEELGMRSHLPVEVRVDLDERLPEVVEETIYYCVSECLANAAKHSRARNCSVAVSRADATVTVVVKDDGQGGARIEPGGGLEGIRDRVEAVSGRADVRSVEGLGTIIELTIPVHA